MAIQVNIGEARDRLSKLLQKVDEGEEVVIARGNQPRYRVSLIRDDAAASKLAVVDRLLALKEGTGSVTQDELRAWRDEGRE